MVREGGRMFLCSMWGIVVAAFVAETAVADTIAKFPLGEPGFDVAFDGTTFGTIDDGNASTVGDQDTGILFTGFLSFLSEVPNSVGSFSLDGVTAVGLPGVIAGVIVQDTGGGTFSLWDGSNTLLLSGTLTDGSLNGTGTATTGSFFNTTLAEFTGGSLASLLDPTSAGLSIALSSITSASGPGLVIGADGRLEPFQADAAGLMEGASSAPIPEPVTGALLLSSLVAMGVKKRRSV